LLGRARATHYRRCQPPRLGPPAPRPAPANALTEIERQHILSVLRSGEFCDLAPAQIWARLLEDGIYLFIELLDSVEIAVGHYVATCRDRAPTVGTHRPWRARFGLQQTSLDSVNCERSRAVGRR